MNEMIETFKVIRQICSDKRGVTALEYGLVAALLATGLLVAMPKLTTALTSLFTTIAGKLVVS